MFRHPIEKAKSKILAKWLEEIDTNGETEKARTLLHAGRHLDKEIQRRAMLEPLGVRRCRSVII